MNKKTDNNLRLFTYGTLKKNFRNNHILKWYEAKFIGNIEITIKNHTMYPVVVKGNYPFPAIVENTSTNPICGEIWTINKNCLYDLDAIESYPDFYQRAVFKYNDYYNIFYYMSLDNGKKYCNMNKPLNNWSKNPLENQ